MGFPISPNTSSKGALKEVNLEKLFLGSVLKKKQLFAHNYYGDTFTMLFRHIHNQRKITNILKPNWTYLNKKKGTEGVFF